MEIKYNKVKEQTLEEFADEHDLIMLVTEREDPSHPKYYAHFENAEVADGKMLIGTYGDGDTPREAMDEYALAISGKFIVLNAYKDNRREIRVPRIVLK